MTNEPPIQHKRRCGPQSINPLCADGDTSPEFILLGDQHKFATNVPYKLNGAEGKRADIQPTVKVSGSNKNLQSNHFSLRLLSFVQPNK